MRQTGIFIALLVPIFSYAAGVDLNSDAILAANLIREPNVQKCFKLFEQGGGVPVIADIKRMPAEDVAQYVIQGRTRFSGQNAGNWEIGVYVSSRSMGGPEYNCNVTKNEE